MDHSCEDGRENSVLARDLSKDILAFRKQPLPTFFHPNVHEIMKLQMKMYVLHKVNYIHLQSSKDKEI